jgi:hypothetical protein
MEDLRNEKMEEMRVDYLMERDARRDWDTALDYVGLNDADGSMTIKEFMQAIDKLKDLGWEVENVDILELLQYINSVEYAEED